MVPVEVRKDKVTGFLMLTDIGGNPIHGQTRLVVIEDVHRIGFGYADVHVKIRMPLSSIKTDTANG